MRSPRKSVSYSLTERIGEPMRSRLYEMCKTVGDAGRGFSPAIQTGRTPTLRKSLVFLFFLIVIVVSFVSDLNVELGFAIFAFELVIFGNIQLARAGWAERDLGFHGI